MLEFMKNGVFTIWNIAFHPNILRFLSKIAEVCRLVGLSCQLAIGFIYPYFSLSLGTLSIFKELGKLVGWLACHG